MHQGTFSDQFQTFEHTKSRTDASQQGQFSTADLKYQGENRTTFTMFGEHSAQEIPDHIKMIFDQQPDEEFARKRNQQGDAFPPGLNNYRIDQINQPSATNQFESTVQEPNIQIPSFSQVMGSVLNNVNNVEKSDHSTPRDMNSPKNAKLNAKQVKKHSNSPRVYNVQVNDDVNLIERIENLLSTIAENYNRYCPFCQAYIELKKSNFQNISAYFSRTKQRYYVVHFNCYLKSSSVPSSGRIRSLGETNPGKCTQIQNSGLLETSNYLRSDRRAYLLTIEGYHPLSSNLFFRIDKTCFSLEHATQGDQLLYLNLTNKSTSIFEPNIFLIPYNEFRCIVTIYLTQSLDEPYQLEFMVDMSEFKLNSEIKSRNLEVAYKNQDGNNVKLGMQAILDLNNEYTDAINYKIPLSDANPASPSFRADFTRSTFFILKYLMIDLPLKRVSQSRPEQQQQQFKQSEPLSNKANNPSPQLDKWNHSNQVDEFSSGPNNRPQTKFTLNSEAPQFNFQYQQQASAGESSFGKMYGGQSKGPGLFNEQNRGQNPQVLQHPQFQQSHIQHTLQPDVQFIYHSDDQPQSDDADDDENEGEKRGHVYTVDHIERSQSGNYLTAFGGNPDIVRFNSANNMSETNKQKSVSISKKNNFSVTSNSSGGTSPNITPQQTSLELPSVGSMERILFGDEKLPEDALETFKLEDYKGKLVEFSKTHNGSRILQKFYPRANQQEIDMIINELSGSLEEIMLDPYANYMFQTLAQSCSSEQRYRLLQKIAPLMPKVACDRKGTHSLQALISIINRDEEERLIEDNLSEYVVMLSKDPQGTHFIQKLVNSISLAHINFIFNAVVKDFLDLANNSYGLCVLKALITKIQKQEEKKRLIIRLVGENVDNLIQNPYGNYAIQHTFETFKDDCYVIWDKIFEKVFQLSNQKFSSNVIERCLTTSNEENKKKFISEVVKSERIVEMMKNKYGNFVLIKIFNVADENDKSRLVEALQRSVNSVNVSKYKNKWLTFLDENKAYLKTSQKPIRYSQGNAFYPSDKSGQQVTINQFPDNSGGNSFRGSTSSFSSSPMQGYIQQPNYKGFNQYPAQGYSQGQNQGYNQGYNPNQSQGYNPNQSQGYSPNQNQGSNQGYNKSFSGGTYYQTQANVIPTTTTTKKQPSMGGGGIGTTGGLSTAGGLPSYPDYQSDNIYSGYQQSGYGFDNSGNNPWSSGTAGFSQGTNQNRKPNYTTPNYFDGQKKF